MARALITATIGVGLIVAGIGFDSPALLVPGLALAALATGAVAWVGLASHRLRVARAPGPARIVEDDPYPLRITATGAPLPPPGGEIDDPLLAEPVAIGPGWPGSLTLEPRLRGRGRRRLAPTRVTVCDPLRLCVREVRGTERGEVLVLPRIEPVAANGGGPGGLAALAGFGNAGARGLDTRPLDLELDGLRAYRHGSPASRIHWPAVARTGELLERRMAAGSDLAPLIALDAGDPASAEALDSAVRAAASLCVAIATAGGCRIALPGDRRAVALEPDLRGWPSLHARLALVAAGEPAPRVRAPGGTSIWVTAAAEPAMPRIVRAGARTAFLVAPLASLGHATPAFTVAGCAGVLVGAQSRRSRHPTRSRAA